MCNGHTCESLDLESLSLEYLRHFHVSGSSSQSVLSEMSTCCALTVVIYEVMCNV